MPTLKAYFCFSFGRPLDGIWVQAHDKFNARNLAAYRLRVPRQLITVKADCLPGLPALL